MCLFGGTLTSAYGADPVTVPSGFTILGSGFGHGIGMSQYGAQAMALDGQSAAQILTYYYQGTTVDAIPIANPNIRVGLIQDRNFVALRGEVIPGTTGGGSFNVVIDANPAVVIAAGVVTTLTTVNGLTQVSSNGVVLGSGTTIAITWDKTITVINVGSGTDVTLANASLGAATCVSNNCSRRYKYGSLEISSGLFGDLVADLVVVNILRLSDEYLYGLGEVPSSWAEAALQAQAIAGRSYAIKKTSNITACNCQIYATTLDQAFVGFSKEIGTSGDRWVAAVNATNIDANNGYVVQYNGAPISTYYSSSTGGKSQDVREVWGGTFPYLITKDDPWSLDPRANNPNSSWTDSIDQGTLVANLRALGVSITDVKTMSVGTRYASGGVSTLEISDSVGNIFSFFIAPGQSITPDRLRSVLGVKSTYISSIEPGLTSIPVTTPAIVAAPAPSPAAAPAAKQLTAVTKVNWPASVITPSNYVFEGKVSPAQVGAVVTLQNRVGGKWSTVSSATTTASGVWKISWVGPPPGKHSLRITAKNSKGSIKTSSKKVSVAGKLALSAPKSAKRNKEISLSGSVSPQLPNVTVTIERRIGSGKWTKAGTVKTDAAGKWKLAVKPGSKKATVSYRVKTSDARLGEVASTTKKVSVK